MDPVTERNARAYDEHASAWEDAMASNVAHLYLEKPAMRHLLPDDLERKDVLCIGVGAGDELADIVGQNPRRVIGMDISRELLKRAKEKFPSVETVQADMIDLPFPDDSFDLVYSSLALHYASDWDTLMAGIVRVLKPDGILLFSTHHPGYWGTKPATGRTHMNERGVVLTEHTAVLPGDVHVTYYNHPDTDSILDSVRRAGLRVIAAEVPQVIEPFTRLSPDDQERYDGLMKKNVDAPLFFIVKAGK